MVRNQYSTASPPSNEPTERTADKMTSLDYAIEAQEQRKKQPASVNNPDRPFGWPDGIPWP